MKILKSNEFLEKLNIGKLNIRDIKLPESRPLPDGLVRKYHLVLNKATGRYDCNDDIEVGQDLIKDGKLITDFGVVKGSFVCIKSRLTSLAGCPTEVHGSFLCSDNQLVSLEGCPAEIGGSFTCYGNQLTSLEGGPVKVGGDFYCHFNNLTSLEGCPKEVGGSFNCQYNKRFFTEDDVEALCNVKGMIHINGMIQL